MSSSRLSREPLVGTGDDPLGNTAWVLPPHTQETVVSQLVTTKEQAVISKRKNKKKLHICRKSALLEKSPLPVFFVKAEARIFHLAPSLNLVNKYTLELELSVQLFLRIIKDEWLFTQLSLSP